MSSNEPMKNGCEVIYEIYEILYNYNVSYIELRIMKYMRHYIYHFTKMFTLILRVHCCDDNNRKKICY